MSFLNRAKFIKPTSPRPTADKNQLRKEQTRRTQNNSCLSHFVISSFLLAKYILNIRSQSVVNPSIVITEMNHKMKHLSIIASLLLLCSSLSLSWGFSVQNAVTRMSTVEAPTKERTQTDKRTRRQKDQNDKANAKPSRYNDVPLEYLEDEWSARNPEDPFHILLLDTTFVNERISVSYVTGCLNYVLGMPEDEAQELTKMCAHNGMSCLGVWQREEALILGRKLQVRDLAVRVVPFAEGGNRGWQAKDAKDASYSSGGRNEGGIGNGGFD
jgi:ATP-dependent Clp protease adapter protein ClpS